MQLKKANASVGLVLMVVMSVFMLGGSVASAATPVEPNTSVTEADQPYDANYDTVREVVGSGFEPVKRDGADVLCSAEGKILFENEETDEVACAALMISLAIDPNPPFLRGTHATFTMSVYPVTDCSDNFGHAAWGGFSFSMTVSESTTWTVSCFGDGMEQASRSVGVYDPAPPPAPSPPPSPPACSDGRDNDGDTLIDMNDPGCSSTSDNDESNVIICADRTPVDKAVTTSLEALGPCDPPIVNINASRLSVAYDDSVTVTWSVSNAASCNYSSSPTTNFSTGGSMSGSQLVGPLKQNTTFTLKCYGQNGTSAEGYVGVTVGPAPSPPPNPGDTQAPTTPSGLSIGGATQTAVTLRWNASTDNVGVTAYDVYRNGSSVGSTASGTRTHSFSGLVCGTTYTLGVAARDAAGNRSTRATVNGTTSACPSTPPSSSCDEYDAQRNICYRYTPDGSGFYTPDGVDPTTLRQLQSSPSIPPPARFNQYRDYCSFPEVLAAGGIGDGYRAVYNIACYRHDVCYGSQNGRGYCDAWFWRNATNSCRAVFNRWYERLNRWECYFEASLWWTAIRAGGWARYEPRQSSYEPRGV